MPNSPYTAGAYYRIKNLTEGNPDLYLTARDAKPGRVYFEARRKDDAHDIDSQLWYVMPLDHDRHLIANRGSGLVLSITNNSRYPSYSAQQGEVQQETTGSSQTWYLRPVNPDDASVARIVNTNSNLYLGPNKTIADDKPAIGAEPVQSAEFAKGDDYSQSWRLETFDGIREVGQYVRRVPGDADAITDVDRLTGFTPPTRQTTDEVLIGSLLIPFPIVNDDVLSLSRRAKENPYYVLKRYGYWRNVYSYDHSGASSFTRERDVTVGLTTSNAKQVETLMGLKVSAKASLGFGGFGAEISAEAEYQLKTNTTDTTTTQNSVTTTIKRSYSPGKRVAEAIWYREDRFVLERLNGEKVIEWKTLNEDRQVSDAYPAT